MKFNDMKFNNKGGVLCAALGLDFFGVVVCGYSRS